MKKITLTAMICAAICSILFVSAAGALAASSNGNSWGGFSGVDHSNRPMETIADTSNTPTAELPVTGENAISMNALVGIWSTRGFNNFYYWSFGDDGRFAYYVTSGQVPMNPSAGVNMAYASEAYFKGNYRVNGNTIEFYNCQHDSFFEYNGTLKYFKTRDFSSSMLLDTPLQNSEKADDFSLMFEFKNASRLRIVIDRGGLRDNYDWLFDYVGTRGNVTIPSHSLPGTAWPKDELPPDLPEYNGGRIMSTNSSSQYYIKIKIDGSTREVFIDYVERMAQSGWDWYSNSTKSEFEAFKRGEGFKNGSTLEKNGYSITVCYSVNEIGLVEIIWWK